MRLPLRALHLRLGGGGRAGLEPRSHLQGGAPVAEARGATLEPRLREDGGCPAGACEAQGGGVGAGDQAGQGLHPHVDVLDLQGLQGVTRSEDGGRE